MSINATSSQRAVMLDVETTGFYPLQNDRVVEIGLVEYIDRRPTGKIFHEYICPQRSMPDAAKAVHGLSEQFLADKPKFYQVADKLMEFIGGSELIIHNAPFDMGFLNMELCRIGLPSLDSVCIGVVDTLVLARKLWPSKKNNLDALCDRYKVNNNHRSLHGALLDAQLLGEVYIAMTRGQESLSMESFENSSFVAENGGDLLSEDLKVIEIILDSEDLESHLAYMQRMSKGNGGRANVWLEAA